MNAKPKGMPGRNDLTDTERQLSELVFANYTDYIPIPGQCSRLSDDFVRKLRGNPTRIMRMVTLLADMVEPEHVDQVSEYAHFHIAPSISIMLKEALGKPLTLGSILAQPLSDPTQRVNPLVLWARAFIIMLQHLYSDVEVDLEYSEVADGIFRPAIRGDGINIISVNGALLEVLREANLTDDIDHSYFATDSDEDGWVFSRGGIDG